MKNFILLSVTFTLFLFFTSCNTEALDETTINLELNSSKVNNNKKTTGFDQWGYNWNAHQFNGYLINAWFGDELNPGAPWYKKEPPYNGDWEGYAEKNPEMVAGIFRAFQISKQESLEKMDSIVADISQYEIFSENFLKNYFNTLKFDFDESFQTGLMKYYQMAKEIGTIEAIPELEFVKV